jgi:hypothetical protein
MKKTVKKRPAIEATPGPMGTVWIKTPNGEEYRLSWESGRVVISAQRIRGNLAGGLVIRPITANAASVSAE